jgi:LmbE family N-acetylglucosaminyl deacetylase
MRRWVGDRLREIGFQERLLRYVRSKRRNERNEWTQPEIIENLPGQKVLVLAPHMDDEVIGCGGTLRKMADAGKEISVLFMTDGRKGDADLRTMTPEAQEKREAALVLIRKEEARQAAEILGIRSVFFLDAEDGKLQSAPATQKRVLKILHEVQPDLLFVPFFIEDHPDHRATTAILLDATRDEALPLTCFAYEVWTPILANTLVEITAVADVKRAAISVYQSQLKDNDFIRSTFGLNAYRSISIGGKGFIEAFWAGPLKTFRALYEADSRGGR